MSKPKNIFQVNYFYFDKYNNEKLIQKRKPVPHNITCIQNNARYTYVSYSDCWVQNLLCRLQRKTIIISNTLVLFKNIMTSLVLSSSTTCGLPSQVAKLGFWSKKMRCSETYENTILRFLILQI